VSHEIQKEWPENVIDSTYSQPLNLPKEALDIGAKVRENVINQYIEFFEMMTPVKMQEY
tara:strand:+ start:903 stop:1079 length:177 start_codon:yes stop_codon:yes gene_type:complete